MADFKTVHSDYEEQIKGIEDPEPLEAQCQQLEEENDILLQKIAEIDTKIAPIV